MRHQVSNPARPPLAAILLAAFAASLSSCIPLFGWQPKPPDKPSLDSSIRVRAHVRSADGGWRTEEVGEIDLDGIGPYVQVPSDMAVREGGFLGAHFEERAFSTYDALSNSWKDPCFESGSPDLYLSVVPAAGGGWKLRSGVCSVTNQGRVEDVSPSGALLVDSGTKMIRFDPSGNSLAQAYSIDISPNETVSRALATKDGGIAAIAKDPELDQAVLLRYGPSGSLASRDPLGSANPYPFLEAGADGSFKYLLRRSSISGASIVSRLYLVLRGADGAVTEQLLDWDAPPLSVYGPCLRSREGIWIYGYSQNRGPCLVSADAPLAGSPSITDLAYVPFAAAAPGGDLFLSSGYSSLSRLEYSALFSKLTVQFDSGSLAMKYHLLSRSGTSIVDSALSLRSVTSVKLEADELLLAESARGDESVFFTAVVRGSKH